MITDQRTASLTTGSDTNRNVPEQDPNDWIPKADEAQSDAKTFLPRIVAAILDGSEARDWNRQ